MAGDVVHLGLVQMRCGPDPSANRARAVAAVEEAVRRGAEVVCLQELFAFQYFCQREDATAFELAEPVPGPSSETFARVARDTGAVLVVPIFERRGEGVFHNTALVIDGDGRLRGRYRKMHIPDDPGYYEKYYFAPGDLGFGVVETQAARLGVLICWDQWFPEAARLAALGGAELLLFPSAIGWQPGGGQAEDQHEYEAWETVQRGHAIANGLFVGVANRVGAEGELRFWGGSFVCDPLGVVLARAGHDDETVLVVPCDRRRIAAVRRAWPFLRDRRVDAYQGLTARWLG